MRLVPYDVVDPGLEALDLWTCKKPRANAAGDLGLT